MLMVIESGHATSPSCPRDRETGGSLHKHLMFRVSGLIISIKGHDSADCIVDPALNAEKGEVLDPEHLGSGVWCLKLTTGPTQQQVRFGVVAGAWLLSDAGSRALCSSNGIRWSHPEP